MRPLTIASTFAARRWWTVQIYPDLAELREAAYRHRPWLGRDYWSDTEGVCHPAGRKIDGVVSYPRNGYVGVIRYALPSFTAEIVAHELVHAATATLRSLLPVADVRLGDGWHGNTREEQLAYIYGELFADFMRQQDPEGWGSGLMPR